MKYRPLGRTGWMVSQISFGAWAIGGNWGHVSENNRLENPTERSCWRDELALGNFRYLMCDRLTDVASFGVATEIWGANLRTCQNGFESPFHGLRRGGFSEMLQHH